MERTQFLGHKRVSGNWVARFKPDYKDEFVLNKSSCEARLRNLSEASLEHDQTEAALQSWPAEVPNDDPSQESDRAV